MTFCLNKGLLASLCVHVSCGSLLLLFLLNAFTWDLAMIAAFWFAPLLDAFDLSMNV